jgi:hypothetical protein
MGHKKESMATGQTRNARGRIPQGEKMDRVGQISLTLTIILDLITISYVYIESLMGPYGP